MLAHSPSLHEKQQGVLPPKYEHTNFPRKYEFLEHESGQTTVQPEKNFVYCGHGGAILTRYASSAVRNAIFRADKVNNKCEQSNRERDPLHD